MSVLEAAKAHFASIKGVEVDVPEWGVTVVTKPLSLRDRQKLHDLAKGKGTRMAVLAVQYYAKDASGTRLFGDGPDVTRDLETDVSPEVLERIAVALNGRGDEDAELGN